MKTERRHAGHMAEHGFSQSSSSGVTGSRRAVLCSVLSMEISKERVLEWTQLLIRLHVFIAGFKVNIYTAFKNVGVFIFFLLE